MVDELKKLKSVLRSLVVSSPTKMTLTNLLRDYRAMMGQPIPITKFGYRDPLQFLKDQCGDCFLFHGSGTNTVLTPIVPECLKHIDEFVHKQKVSAKDKYKGKRMSINESAVRPSPNLISQTFEARCNITTRPPAEIRDRCKQPPAPAHTPTPQRNPLPPEFDTKPAERKITPKPNVVKKNYVEPPKPVDNNINRFKSRSNLREENKENKHQDQSLPTKEAYKNFMKSRIPVYESTADLSNDSRSYRDSESGSYSSESGLRTLSSTSSSTKATQLEELKAELLQIIRDSPNGVCTTEIMKMYRERYNRELNFSRFGFSSVSALACSLPGVFTSRDVAGNTRVALAPPDTSHSNVRRQVARPRALRTAALLASKTGDDDDALPWIDFDPDVFPEDCMSFSESIPSASLEDVAEGAMLEVMVGEVYSPSHFWLYRLGERHNIAMEDMMDHMTSYYNSGEGAQRSLAGGAVRVGHYCSSVYEQDWHRSLIVSILDSDTVKVRHVDYGTVDRVCVRRLKPLLREWGELPAQAVRARLAGVCPAARGRRWPHAAAAAFLRLVQDRRLVAEVAHVDRQENILELFLVDTSTERDIRIDLELIKSGHADACPTTDAHSLPSYLYPRFDALESGATPNYAEIHAYLADGIALEYVEDYIRHVPPVLPPPRDHGAVTPAYTHARVLDNRIPLIPRALIDTAVVAPIVNSTASEEEIAVHRENHECVDVRNASLADPGETLIEWEESHKDEIHSDAPLDSEEASVEQPNDCLPNEEARAPSPAPLAPTARAQSQKLLEASPEKTKPACRAAPRMVPDFRSLQQRPEPPPNAFLGAPLMSAPSVPAFFVFPPPPPYPSFPVHPAFPPRCPPGLEGFSPQRTFHPQMRPPHYPRPAFGPPPPIASSGPVYSSIHSQQPFSSGPVYTANHPQPAYACPPASVPNTLVFTPHISSTPVSSRPILKSSDSPAAPVSTVPPLEGSRPAPPVVATASVAPTLTTAHSHSPPPPYNGGPRRFSTGHGDVTLSVSECEIFNLLSSVDPNAAHWYMVDAISRAMSARTTDATHSPVPTARESDQRSAASRLNPEASEFRSSTLLRPPRGFNGD